MSDAEILFDDYEEGQDLCQEADFLYLAETFYRSKDNDE